MGKGKGLPHQSGNYDFCGIYPDVGDLKLRAAGVHHGNGRQFRGNLGPLAGAVLCADWSGLLADCGCADCWYLRKGSCGVQLRRSVWCSEYQFRGRMDTLVGILSASGFGQLNAFCLMVFCLLYIPCAAALATIRKESGSTRWMLLSALFQLIVAWVVTFIVYRIGLFI